MTPTHPALKVIEELERLEKARHSKEHLLQRLSADRKLDRTIPALLKVARAAVETSERLHDRLDKSLLPLTLSEEWDDIDAALSELGKDDQ